MAPVASFVGIDSGGEEVATSMLSVGSRVVNGGEKCCRRQFVIEMKVSGMVRHAEPFNELLSTILNIITPYNLYTLLGPTRVKGLCGG